MSRNFFDILYGWSLVSPPARLATPIHKCRTVSPSSRRAGERRESVLQTHQQIFCRLPTLHMDQKRQIISPDSMPVDSDMQTLHKSCEMTFLAINEMAYSEVFPVKNVSLYTRRSCWSLWSALCTRAPSTLCLHSDHSVKKGQPWNEELIPD